LFLKKKKNIKGIKTCNMSFFRNDCIKINGFNNDIEGWGREDSEFVVRLFNSSISKKNVYFNSIQYHLWHEDSSRASLKKNEAILEETIKNMLVRCQNGLNIFDK